MKIKTFFLPVLLVLSALSLTAQTAPRIGKIYIFSAHVPVEGEPEKFRESAKLTDATSYLEPGYKFRVVDESDTLVKLIAVDFDLPTESQSKNKDSQTFKSNIYNGVLYTVKRKNFEAFASEVETPERVSVGLLTLPFKARPQGDFTFDTEFNLNSTLNIKLWDIAGGAFNYQLGAGIGSVGLNTSNATKLIDDEAQDVAVLTFLHGIMLQYKRVQVGLYMGVDQINNQKNYDWESNGNLWFGFGIGYNLFNIAVGTAQNRQAE